MNRIAVFGGTGFVGAAIVRHLRQRGDVVSVFPAPRLRSDARDPEEVLAHAARLGSEVLGDLRGFDGVVNAAGVAQAPARDHAMLTGANALWPTLLHDAARGARVARFVHLSSAAVQGRTAVLDEESTHAPDSVYSRSKALGEAALTASGWERCVILRPTSVHGADRHVTLRLASLARSAFSVVEAPGTRHTPQVHVDSVARAVGVLVDPAEQPPHLILQPSEGFSVAEFMTVMGGGHRPRLLPRRLSNVLISGAFAAAHVGGSPVWAQARRAEILLTGQEQVPGWLAHRDDVVTPPAMWEALAADCRTRAVDYDGHAN